MQRISCIFFLYCLFQLSHAACAEQAVTAVRPEQTFTHDIEISGGAPISFNTISIAGPRLYSVLPLSAVGKNDAKRDVPYNWYKILRTSGRSANHPYAGTLVHLRGVQYRISAPEYVLVPAVAIIGDRRLLAADDENIMAAFPLRPANQSETTPHARRNEPQYLCLPIIQKHHDEWFTIHPQANYYAVDPIKQTPAEGRFSTVDQFGIHKLRRLRNTMQIGSISSSTVPIPSHVKKGS